MIKQILPIRSLPILAAGTLSLVASLPLPAVAATDPACEPMFDAFTKLLQTPNHQYMSQSSETEALKHGGKIRTSESISTSDSSYLKINDEWHKIPITAQDLLKQQEEARRNSKETCHFLNDDQTEGDAAVYDSHSETNLGKSDLKIWITKATGLPAREEIDLDLGGEAGKTHSSVRFDYDQVEAPKDVKVDPRDAGK
jgi:hypothetical protein